MKWLEVISIIEAIHPGRWVDPGSDIYRASNMARTAVLCTLTLLASRRFLP